MNLHCKFEFIINGTLVQRKLNPFFLMYTKKKLFNPNFCSNKKRACEGFKKKN